MKKRCNPLVFFAVFDAKGNIQRSELSGRPILYDIDNTLDVTTIDKQYSIKKVLLTVTK